MAMNDVGIEIEAGSGVAAAQKFWRKAAQSAASTNPTRSADATVAS
jgi:hypothetical protein